MTYPIEDMAALAHANLGLAFRLADVARKGGQETFQIGTEVIGGLVEDACSAVAGVIGLSSVPTGKAAVLLPMRDFEKVGDHVVAQTRAAIDAWQEALADAYAWSAVGQEDDRCELRLPGDARSDPAVAGDAANP